MPSTSAPSDPSPADAREAEATPVWHYDGVTAVRRHVSLRVVGDGFTLDEGGERFAFADLTPANGDDGGTHFGLRGRTGWGIDFGDAVPVAIARHLPAPARYGGVIDRWGLWRAAALFAVVAALVVAVVLRTPALVARMVPAAVEQRLGDVMMGDFGRKGCSDPAGDAALSKLVARIDPGDPAIEVHVVKLPMVNAVTLPGGRIVVFDGLIKAAASPDEVAGVIGHEIGHVRNRDVMESLLRQLGLSVLLGGMEGHVGGYTNTLLATAYSREAESRADGRAIGLLADAHLSPMPTARFFARLGRQAGGTERMFAYLASHPVSADRARRFRDSRRPGERYAPALGAADWAALRGICRNEKDGFDWRF